MKLVFADTAFFVAFLNPRDQHHALAVECMETMSFPLLTTQWILAELGNYLSRRKGRKLVGPFISALESEPLIRIVEADADGFGQGLALYDQHQDKEWSLIDCISFEVMREHEIEDALTSDHHFEQAGFNILMQ